MRLEKAPAAVALTLAATLPACAPQGYTPTGTPSANVVTLHMSAAPAQPTPGLPSLMAIPPSRITIGCDNPVAARPVPPTGAAKPPPATPNVTDSSAAERARRALEAANPPIPRRAPIPPEAAPAAESCARSLQPDLTLLAVSPGGLADEQSLRRVLTSAGLTKIIIQPGPAFAAAAGKACVYGTFPSGKPELSIGPQQPDGSCHP